MATTLRLPAVPRPTAAPASRPADAGSVAALASMIAVGALGILGVLGLLGGCASDPARNSDGCTFDSVSAATVEPATPCLTVRPLAPSGTVSCTEPTLEVANGCTEALVLQGLDGVAGEPDGGARSVTVGAGVTDLVTLPSAAKSPHTVTGTLGATPVVIRFTTSLGDDQTP